MPRRRRWSEVVGTSKSFSTCFSSSGAADCSGICGIFGTASADGGTKLSAAGFGLRSCFLRNSTAFMSRILSGVIALDLWDGNDLTLPRESGRGLYSGKSGIGGGVGRVAAGEGAGPGDFGAGCSCFLKLDRNVAGIVEMLATVGLLDLSPTVTGRGASLTFGLSQSGRRSSSYLGWSPGFALSLEL